MNGLQQYIGVFNAINAFVDWGGDRLLSFAGRLRHAKWVAPENTTLELNRILQAIKDRAKIEAHRYAEGSQMHCHLISDGLLRKTLNAKDKQFGATALHMAVWYGQPDIVQMLVQNNADINIRDADGQTPLIWADLRANDEMILLLSDLGAKSTRKVFTLHATALPGNTQIVCTNLSGESACFTFPDSAIIADVREHLCRELSIDEMDLQLVLKNSRHLDAMDDEATVVEILYSSESPCEMRVDPCDRIAYSRQAFLQYYGRKAGRVHWERAEKVSDDIEAAKQQSILEAIDAENAQISEALLRSQEDPVCAQILGSSERSPGLASYSKLAGILIQDSRIANKGFSMKSESSSIHSCTKISSQTLSSGLAVIRPASVVVYSKIAGLLHDGRLPSKGTLDHSNPDSCWPCKAFTRGDCAHGAGCHKCHASDHDQHVASKGGGARRQRLAKQRGSCLRMSTPDPFA